jgi:endonuclease/exonuclease/phosphatase family metal-dependent hydrolase
MRVLQWNIGGGRIRENGADPIDVSSYSTESIIYLARLATEYDPDIITLQETHQGPDGHNQAQALADAIGFNHWKNDTHDESHIEKGQKFGQAILSRFPLIDHIFERLPNPNLTVVSADGEKLHSHNYGISSANVVMPDGIVRVQTLHLPALHFFEITPDMQEGEAVLTAVSQYIEKPTYPTVIPGDYNLDTLFVLDLLPGLREKGFNETSTKIGTTPKGKRLDHIVHFGFRNVSISVLDSALTDHFPLIADLDIS